MFEVAWYLYGTVGASVVVGAGETDGCGVGMTSSASPLVLQR